MRNSQLAAVATAGVAVAIGLALASASGAATAPDTTSSGNAITATADLTSPAVKALSCGSAAVVQGLNKHFGNSALSGAASYADSATKALDSYLNEIGSTASVSDFRATGVTTNRILFTSIATANNAVVIDNVTPGVFDWRMGARCA